LDNAPKASKSEWNILQIFQATYKKDTPSELLRHYFHTRQTILRTITTILIEEPPFPKMGKIPTEALQFTKDVWN
jgi:hypothetical protein